MLGWNMEIENKEIKETLKELQGKLDNMKPVMQDISETMLKKVHENFDKEGRPGKWPGLADKTRERRSRTEVRMRDEDGKHVKYKKGDKKGQYRTRKVKATWPGKILQESGLLMDSITPDFDETSAMVGTNKIYASTHHFGDPNRNIPERAFLVLTDEDQDEITDDVRKFLKLT